MILCPTVDQLRTALAPNPSRDKRHSIGFVPTMGALHEGHLALVRAARTENDLAVVSIFVNPTQFGPNEDLSRYPRAPERDAALLESAGVDLLFMPAVEEMYPPGFSTRVSVEPLAGLLEGASRPEHFAGVATVVTRLLNVVRPSRAYFGQKDAQQLAVIRRVVTDLAMPVQIVAVPTVREPDGLALSSRNAYLSTDDRAAATVLYRALLAARDACQAGEVDAAALRGVMTAAVAHERRASLDYADVVDASTMEPRATAEAHALLVIAARLGSTRLIDNMALE